MKMPSFSLTNVATAVLSAGTALMVIGLLPLSENLVDDTKLYGLFLTSLVMGVLFAIAIVKRGAIELILSKLTYAVIGFLLAITASTFFINTYPVKAVLSFGGVFIAAGLLVLFASPLLNKASKKIWFTTFITVTLLLVITSFLELIGIGPSKLLTMVGPFNAPATAVLFNLSGSILNALQLCLIGVVGIFATWLASKKASPFQLVSVVVLLLGVLLYGYFMLPGKSNLQLPGYGSSWSIALDSVRDPRGALIGSGTGAYQDMYQRFKPFWVNTTDQWATIFSAGANMPLTLLTISGFIGLIAWVALLIIVILETRKASADEVPVLSMILATFVIQLIFPPNVVVLMIQASLIALHLASKRSEYGVLHFSFFQAKTHRVSSLIPGRDKEPKWPLYLTSGVIMILLALATYFLARFYIGSYYSLLAAKSFAVNDALGVYNNQQRAIAFNPYLDVYRRRYALTSASIAEILAQKTDKTAQDNTTISELVQQAVREGQAAVTLDQADAQNHALLASIYQRLIGGVDGAETFAEQYYVAAINLYPSAPELYVSLAGIYLSQEQWQRAVSVLNQALQVKSDFPNTYFNLGFALEKLEAYTDAKLAYERVLESIQDPNSEDYVAITKKIEELTDLIAKQQAAIEANGGAQTQTQGQNPSAVELNLNNDNQTVGGQENVQVNQRSLPASPPPATGSAQTTPAPTPAATPAQ